MIIKFQLALILPDAVILLATTKLVPADVCIPAADEYINPNPVPFGYILVLFGSPIKGPPKYKAPLALILLVTPVPLNTKLPDIVAVPFWCLVIF